jgi:nucleoside-diphosphate-sugar epimerase
MDKLIIGCGYLGRRVARLWLEHGQRVWASTRRAEGVAELRTLGLQPIVCDVLSPGTLRDLPRMSTVLYCVGFDRSADQTMRDVYVEGLRRVLDVLTAPERFIYISSTSVYGQSSGEWVDETSPTEPEEESGRIVLDAEKALRPDAIILRFAGIYGPGRLLRRQAVESGEVIRADPERWLNLIHVDDGAAAVLATEQHARPGAVYNVCDDTPIPRRAFYERLAELLGAAAPRFEPPAPGTPLPPHERANRRISNRRLRDELHFAPRHVSFREGLSDCQL